MSLVNSQALNASTEALVSSAIVALYVIDATNIPGGTVFRFCPQTDANNNPIIWQGNTYTPIPMDAKGFDIRGQGAPARPRLTLGNVGGQITALCLILNDLVGAKVIRKRTQARYLDGRPGANPGIAFPDDVFHVEQKMGENKLAVEFELGTSMDVDDVELPKRQVIAGTCIWSYRDANCGFAGNTAVAEQDGTPFPNPKVYRGVWLPDSVYITGDVVFLLLFDGRKQFYRLASHTGDGISGQDTKPSEDARWVADECGKHTADCVLRFGAIPSGLPFGGWPAANRQSA